MTEYTDEAILTELRRVASIVTAEALTTSLFSKHSRVSRDTVTRRFGSWKNALEKACLGDRFSENVGVRGAHVSTRMSNDDVLKSLRDLSIKLNKSELTLADVKAHLPFGRETLVKRWGTPRAAFEAAGLSATNLGRRYDDEECFDNLLAVWTHYGRPPMYREMGFAPSKVGGKAYVKRFGTWSKALAAFAERVNGDGEEPSARQDASQEATASATSNEVNEPQYGRDVPLGLRFKVLRRDFFKCVLCGDNPPRNSDCVLHVDHILPWSRGGMTAAENLRTLCANCNVGRGNRYLD